MVALDSTREELDGFVDLVFEVTGHLADLSVGVDAKSVQLLLNERSHALDALKIVFLVSVRRTKDAEINGL